MVDTRTKIGKGLRLAWLFMGAFLEEEMLELHLKRQTEISQVIKVGGIPGNKNRKTKSWKFEITHQGAPGSWFTLMYPVFECL